MLPMCSGVHRVTDFVFDIEKCDAHFCRIKKNKEQQTPKTSSSFVTQFDLCVATHKKLLYFMLLLPSQHLVLTRMIKSALFPQSRSHRLPSTGGRSNQPRVCSSRFKATYLRTFSMTSTFWRTIHGNCFRSSHRLLTTHGQKNQ